MFNDKIVNKQFKETDATIEIECEINELITELIGFLSLYKPEAILKAFSEYEISRLFYNRMVEQWDINELHRYTEYIQSLFVSTSIKFQNLELEQENFTKLKLYIDRVFELIDKYWYTFKLLDSSLQKEIASDLSLDIIEAQFMYRVRGDRYPALDNEYFQLLLMPHEDLFEEIFEMSVESIISGFEALKKSLFDNFNSISIEMLKEWERFKSLSKKKQKEYFERKSSNAEINRIGKLLGGFSRFEVQSVTNWKESFIQSLSFNLDEDKRFSQHNHYKFWPIVDLPIKQRPFITINDIVYCFDYYSFVDNFYRALQKMVKRVKPNYNWSDMQMYASESAVVEIFNEILPDCNIYQSNYYKSSDCNDYAENDLLILYNDTAFIIEVKAGSFVYTAPFEDFSQHIKSYKTLLEKASKQASRMQEYIGELPCSQVTLTNSDHSDHINIDFTRIKQIYKIVVTVEQMTTMTAKIDKLSFLDNMTDVWCISIVDLLTIKHIIKSPFIFLDFIKNRFIALNNDSLYFNDELDHLEAYMLNPTYNKSLSLNGGKTKIMAMDGHKNIDQYMMFLNENYPQNVDNGFNLPNIYREMLNINRGIVSDSKLCILRYILSFSRDDKNLFGRACEYIKKENLWNKLCYIKSLNLTIILRKNKDIKLVEFENSWGFNNNRILEIKYSKVNRVVDYACYSSKYPINENNLYTISNENLSNINCSTIERNDYCPCGSNKKYKKCCGRYA